ncbi:hypothetical protein CRE_30401 [Caenorhabditis remanei]|uniref:DUF19 domain-containing protein n=1 Tax=Caenorhabditis remanei TaxID=31234 RepID=E3NAG2_CAERE|nr:hypothetical protein CRE_30401 [Caenorhabditis remanei]
MHQTLILLLFLVSVYSAGHPDSLTFARELRNSTESSGGPEYRKLNLTKMGKNSTIKHSVPHFPIKKTSEIKGNLEKLTPRMEKTKIHHTTPKDHQKTKGRSHSNITLTNNLHTVSSQKLSGQYEKKLDKTMIPEQMKRVTEKVNAILRSRQINHSLKERNSGKTSGKLGANSTKHKVKPKRKLMRKLSTGPALTEDDERTLVDQTDIIGKQLKGGKKCGGEAELETCKDRILKKAVDVTPLSIPIADSYSVVATPSDYGNVKIGLILAKSFDNCYDKNDKSDKFLECLKAGGEKSPLIVAYDEIAKQVGYFCDAKGDATCRPGAVKSNKNVLETAINAILGIFCNEKNKDPNCQAKMKTTAREIIKGNLLDKESDTCKKETNIDKYINCLKNISLCLFHLFISETFAKKVADNCGSDINSERSCRETEKKDAEELLKKVVEALFTNQCGETEKRERGYQLCLKTKLDKVSTDLQLPAPIIKFQKIPLLKDIVADAQYGKIAIGSTVGDKVKGCQKTNKSWKINDFLNCLGTHEKAPLKTAMEEIGNQLTSHCAKVPSDERECRRDGEVDVKKKIKKFIKTYFKGFSLSFKLLDEVDVSKFSRKDENGEIKIGEILKKETESCKNFKTRDEFFNCLKAAPLKTAKNALDAILTNFCREVFQKSEKEYTDCLNFDGSELKTLSILDNIPATIYAITDISKFQTPEDYGGIKIGEMLQNVLVPCDGKTTVNEYFSCVSGPQGATTSPWIDITAKIGKELADVCGQKEIISDCRNYGKIEADTKMREMAVDLIMNFCGKNAGENQQTYAACSSSVDGMVDTLPTGEIIQNLTGMCKNMKTLDEAVDCLKTSKGAEPSPTKAARDSISDKFSDYALQQKFGDDDWKQGVEEVRKEFKKAIQALISNFCRDNVNTVQNSYIICLDNGLINSEVLSQGYTPTDVFLQCSLKTTESDFNQCIDTVTSQRLSSWTASCASNPSKETECRDAAKKSSAETATVAKVAAKLVSCDDSTCIQTEKQKVIDAFAENDGKYCNTPCKDSKVQVTAAVNKGFSLALKDSNCHQSFPDPNDSCGGMCAKMARAKAVDDNNSWKIWFDSFLYASIIPGLFILCCIGYSMCKRCKWCKRKPESKKKPTDVQSGVPISVLKSKKIINKDDEKEEDEEGRKPAVEDDNPAEDGGPSLKNNPALERMRDKLKQTQDNLRLLRTHANKCAEEHKKDLANKFTPMGPIYIPKEPEVPPPPPDAPSSNVSLENVAWKDGLNELWEVGSDVDDIELDEPYVLNPDSVTESEASQKSGKAKSSSKSKSKESKKVPSTSGTGPSTSGTGPSTSGTGPSTSGTGPSTSGTGPSTSGTGPSTSGTGPSTSGTGPSTSGTGPSTSGTGPSTSGTGPSTSGTGPSTLGIPSVSALAPTASAAEPRESSASSSVQPDQQPSTSGLPSVSAPGTRFNPLPPTAPAAEPREPSASSSVPQEIQPPTSGLLSALPPHNNQPK